jgi:hypothetical protein
MTLIKRGDAKIVEVLTEEDEKKSASNKWGKVKAEAKSEKSEK